MFTGLAYVDVMNFDKSSINTLDGYKIIRSSRVKTDESFISLFLPEAQEMQEYCGGIIAGKKWEAPVTRPAIEKSLKIMSKLTKVNMLNTSLPNVRFLQN